MIKLSKINAETFCRTEGHMSPNGKGSLRAKYGGERPERPSPKQIVMNFQDLQKINK